MYREVVVREVWTEVTKPRRERGGASRTGKRKGQERVGRVR